MIRTVFTWLLILVAQTIICQTNKEITIEFIGVNRLEALKDLEKKVDYTFYFEAGWFDDSKVTKSFTNETLNSVLTELAKTNYVIVHLLAKDHCYLSDSLSDQGKNIQYKIYSNMLSSPVLNLMFHTFVMPWIFMFEKSEIIY